MELERRDLWFRGAFFLLLAAIYGAAFCFLQGTSFFDVTLAHNDRLFSADDVYCALNFYAVPMDTSARIIKHPLFLVLASALTWLEGLIFGPVSAAEHYGHIVLLQMGLSLLSTLYLERILRLQVGLSQRRALLLCAVYALAFSTLFYTFVAETYIWSALLLLMTFFYARRGSGPVLVVLGVLAAGVTITNCALWAVIVWLGHPGRRRERALVLLLGGVCFCAITALLPVGEFFFANIISGGLGSAQSFRDQFPLGELLVRIFYAFFGSTVFWLDTVSATPFGAFPGDALSFLPSAPVWITAACLVWLALLVWTAAREWKNPLLWAPLGVLGCNLLLHGVIQYGLKEGFLYSLHHWPAQVLIAALSVRPQTGRRPGAVYEGILWGFLLCEILLNLSGYRELVQFLTR